MNRLNFVPTYDFHGNPSASLPRRYLHASGVAFVSIEGESTLVWMENFVLSASQHKCQEIMDAFLAYYDALATMTMTVEEIFEEMWRIK